jgi:hypothetical protein
MTTGSGIGLTAASGAFTAPNLLIPPLPSFATPLIWAAFGGSLAASQNKGSGGAFANIGTGPTYPAGAGAPWGSGYGTFSSVAGTAALQGPNDTGGSITTILAFRTTSGAGGYQFPLSSEGSDNKGYFWKITAASGVVSVSILGAAGGNTMTLGAGALANFKMFAQTHTDGSASDYMYDLTDGTQTGPAGTTTARNFSATGPQWLIGENVDQTGLGTMDIAFAAVIPAALSLSTLQAIYATMKPALSIAGISI